MSQKSLQRIRVVDSHTGGEPTRVVVRGAPEPCGKTMREKREAFACENDWIRTATVCEPRGHDAMVGALLCKPCADDCIAGVIFFNNVGVLRGCLHGTMGLAVTLQHLGLIGSGKHRIDTPTGVVTVDLAEDGATVTVGNVRSYRSATGVEIVVSGYGTVRGDVAWGGNWFFLAEAPSGLRLEAGNIEQLTDFTWRIRNELEAANIRGTDGEEIDHIEIFGPPSNPETADSKNFVLCPGKAYDRSPCGTGTSAKLACLAANGQLEPGGIWRQAGILDSVFTGSIELATGEEGGVMPTVTGTAYLTGESDLLLDPADPFVTSFSVGLQDVTLLNEARNPVGS
ncbi:MAG: proline racemase family protein [Verrucomicrobiales bacterium]|nr:proline racemase family protein [Verrucomicrobiales bacterium]